MDNEEIVRGSLSKIEGAAVRMTSLITDVLQYSQLSVSDTLFVETDLNTILDGVINDFDLLISDKQAVISRQQLPTISAIPIQMSQLFSNLIGNAIKFSNRPPKISISVAPLAENITGFEPKNTMDYIKIEVRDNGIGFDDKYGEQIFRLFQRAHNDKKGTGIGLALCKKVVENHGGHIAVRSQINIGTTFTIVLPVSS
jgi:signal transduction histidine kinase